MATPMNAAKTYGAGFVATHETVSHAVCFSYRPGYVTFPIQE